MAQEKELFDWSCQSCGAHLGKYPDCSYMENVDLECDNCGQDDTSTGCDSIGLAEQAINKLKELGYEWNFEECEFIKK